jgi:hypothetical protein
MKNEGNRQMLDQHSFPAQSGPASDAGGAAGTARAPQRPAGPLAWSADFAGTEHPETARLRLQRDYIATVTALKRESADQTYAYLSGLIDKAKEELGHSRNTNNDSRRAMLQQHIDELGAYVTGHGITIKLPNRYAPNPNETAQGFYVIDEIPAWFGEVKFLIDLWYDQHLAKVHDEVSALIGLRRPAGGEQRLVKTPPAE